MKEMIPGLRFSGTAAFCLFLALIILLAQASGDWGQRWLRWDRGALQEFEWWRLWTGHLIHASWPHVGLNLAGLGLVAWLFPEPVGWKGQALRFVWLSLFISLLMYATLPELYWYVGLSGVLHGSFVLGLWWLWKQGDGLAALLLALLVGKLIYEHFFGPLTSDEELVGVPVLTQAHSFGALGAAIWLLVRWGLAKMATPAHNAPP
ncbi:MAG: rhombosortase [Oceanococcaceae bacterium]